MRQQQQKAQTIRSEVFAAARKGNVEKVKKGVWENSVDAAGGEIKRGGEDFVKNPPKDTLETLMHICARDGNAELLEWLDTHSTFMVIFVKILNFDSVCLQVQILKSATKRALVLSMSPSRTVTCPSSNTSSIPIHHQMIPLESIIALLQLQSYVSLSILETLKLFGRFWIKVLQTRKICRTPGTISLPKNSGRVSSKHQDYQTELRPWTKSPIFWRRLDNSR